ncbi:MAG: hypothetical protein M5U33_07785 [Pseudorhodoplanes sp.]|nr:hypothetical protein [Pseudorhodoplanes sp.]
MRSVPDMTKKDRVCLIAFAEQHVAGRQRHLGRERFQPIHVQVALGGVFDLPHHEQHLPKAQDIERQQEGVQDEQRVGGLQIAIRDKEYVARNADEAQRNHCLHREGQEDEQGRDGGDDIGQCERHYRFPRFLYF